jgi:hypothetical protein
MWLFGGQDRSVQLLDCERYLQVAVDQGDRVAEMQLAVFLMSGVLGRFDFEKARTLLERPRQSNPFAAILRDSLSTLDDELVSSSGFSKNGSIFSLLRWFSDDSTQHTSFYPRSQSRPQARSAVDPATGRR